MSDDGQLHPDLIAPSAATTLFFVGRSAVRYYAKSDDPIFPAQSWAHSSQPQEPHWSHSGVARTVLGCVDEKYVRDRETENEWYLLNGQLHDTASDHPWNITPPAVVDINETPYSDIDFTALQLLCLALCFSDAASTAKFEIEPDWLEATSRLVPVAEGQMSLPLDPYQWQIEALNLFNLPLARIQNEILKMTQPFDINPGDDLENFFQNKSIDPCRLIKTNASGWRNISVVGLAGMLGLALGLWIISLETGDTIVLVWLYKKTVANLLVPLFAGLHAFWQLVMRGLGWLYDSICGLGKTWPVSLLRTRDH